MLAEAPAIRCPQCSAQCPAGTKFCGQCGGRLPGACLACGATNALGQRFCGQCGAPLAAERTSARFASPDRYTPRHLAERILRYRSELEGERKQVTILFADIKGSLELLSDRDPEDARKLLDDVLGRMMDAVHRYEGTVNQVLGDGIMAMFGAPVAHEDHAVRACYAALQMRRRIERYAERLRRTDGVLLQIRIGVNSGEVVVRTIGNDLHMDYSAVGQTTHLAGRMEQMAAPGSILITAETLRLVEGYVQVKTLGAVPVRGLASPVDVFEVLAAGSIRSRLQAAAARGFTRFVGRTSELATLRETLEAAAAGRMQMVAITGEAGVGKSRLLHEFVHSPGARGWLLLEANAVSYGKPTPYLPVVDLLTHYFRIEAPDEPRLVREKVAAKVLGLDGTLQDAIPPVLELLDALPEDHAFRTLEPLQRRLQTERAVARLLLAESRVQPLLIVFEDLHWTDSLTLGLLKSLVGALEHARAVLLASHRPDFDEPWAPQARFRRLLIEPLSRASSEELLHDLLGSDPDLAGLRRILVERVGGNPFFLEEIVRTLVETGVLSGQKGAYRVVKPLAEARVPATVQAVIAARMDRLPADEKRLLQEAAVIGTTVPIALLRAIADLSSEELDLRLARLRAAEFIYETHVFPDVEYTFKHALTHEVAYAGLLHARRREIHARVLRAMETLYADRMTERVERLAHHAWYGEVWDRAVTYLRQAAHKAVERPAYREAAALLERALAALQRLPQHAGLLEQAIDIRFDLRNALQPLGERERIFESLREAEQLAERLGDRRRLGWIQSYLADHYWILGRAQDAAAAAARALEIAREIADLPLQVVTHLPLGLLYHTSGEYRRAMEYFRHNVDLLRGDLECERFGLFVLPSSFSRSFLAWTHAEIGEFSEAAVLADEGVRIAEEAGHSFSIGYARLGKGVAHLRQGDVARAAVEFERALGLGAFADIPVGYSYVAFHLGYALALGGSVAEGLSILERTVALAESSGFVARHALRLAYLGEVLLIAGRTDQAAKTAERALVLARKHGERANEAYALRVLGLVAARSADSREAEIRLTQALDLAQRLEMRPLVAQCHHALAGMLEAGERAGEAAAHRGAATAMFRAMDLAPWGPRIQRGAYSWG
jgi:class 3 adenylate cyclase/tetratricopeptide (TPR) repeat protein